MRKNSYNSVFFKNNTEASLYWAGFIAADGCMYKYGKGHRLQINLSTRDLSHINAFKRDIQYDGNVYESTRRLSNVNKRWKDSSICSVVLTLNRNITNDLHRFNIFPNKTKKYSFPEWLIDHSMVHHFMRGYFDGDGCWWKTGSQHRFSTLGTKEFLNVFGSILRENECVKNINIYKKVNINTLNYSGNRQVYKIAKYLYKESNTFLERKLIKIKDLIND